MADKDRYQNPVIGDTVVLRLFAFNSNETANVNSINEVKIYYLDPAARTDPNPDGRTLIQTIAGGDVTLVQQGEYELDLYLDPGLYTNDGRYIDEWNITFDVGDTAVNVDQLFQIYPELWYTTPIPVVYDFNFYFQPNRFRKGEKKYVIIEIVPNVPTATDLQTYYENLAISANVYVSISQRCGDCVPCEQDLRLIVDRQLTTYREKNRAYFVLDTSEMNCGIYDIWFELDFGDNVYMSPNNQIEIYS